MLLDLENQAVRGLFGPEAVIVELLAEQLSEELARRGDLREAAVEEARAVVGPGQPRELGPAHDIRQVLARQHVAHVEFGPVGAGDRDPVAEELSVVGRRELVHRDRPFARERVRVDEDPGGGQGTVDHAGDRLVLEPGIAGEEEPPARLLGQSVAGIVPEGLQPPLDRSPLGHLRQRRGRRGPLGSHPRGRLRRIDILHPAVGIRHLRAEVVVHLGPPKGCRVIGSAGGG